MIDLSGIKDILATYKKYGWLLRRVLLTDKVRNGLRDDIRSTFGAVPIIPSDLDAAWFSREPQQGATAWEIRHLSTNPYALVEHVDESSAHFEATLAEVEGRLRTAVRRNL
jgi:hypothetical protein